MTMPPDSARGADASIGDLLVDVSRDVSVLLRQELELAKAELRQSATSAGKGAGELGGAAVAAHLSILFVSIAVWWGIGDGLGRGWAGLIVAVFWLLVAGGLALMGRKDLKAVTGLPKTTGSVKRIPDAVKGKEDTP